MKNKIRGDIKCSLSLIKQNLNLNILIKLSKYTDQIIKEIVAFINADGGKIYIGINDDGTVCGAQKIDESLRSISDIITTQNRTKCN